MKLTLSKLATFSILLVLISTFVPQLAAVSNLNSAFTELQSYSHYHPSKGYWWQFRNHPDSAAAAAAAAANKEKQKKVRCEVTLNSVTLLGFVPGMYRHWPCELMGNKCCPH